MTARLRPCILPDDYAAMAAIQTAACKLPVTAEDLAAEVAWHPEGTIAQRLILEDVQGQPIGFCTDHRFPNTVVGKFYVHVVVHPAAQRQGAGARLLAAAEQFAVAHGGTRFVGDVDDENAAARAFLERRGYVVERHGYDSDLQLASWDRARFAHVIPQAEQSGIRFFTLADQPVHEALYALYAQTMVDIPGYEAKSFMTYETWQKAIINCAGARPDWVFVAADGDRLVGVTQVVVDGDHLYTHHTLVDRAYRGRGIALALKLLTIEAAIAYGAPFMRTGNDSLNRPMLAVNRKLGYQPLAGAYTVVKRI